MKELFLKTLLFLLIAIAINNLLFRSFNLPFCWGNDIAWAKTDYLLKHKDEFNTLFVGTSKTYWQADVTAFDSLTNHKTKTYNFGIDAIAGAEIFNYTDNLVSLDKNIKYVFIEVYDVDLIIKQNLHTCRQKYWLNFDAWYFTVKSICTSNFKVEDKYRGLFYNTITLFEWILKMDLLKDVNRFKHTPPNPDYLGNNNTGFVALGDEKVDTAYHLFYRNHLLKDTSINSKLAEASIRAFTNPGDSIRFNTAYYQKLKHVVKSLEDKNIKVFLVIAPRTTELQLSNIVPAFTKTDNCTKINLADARLNPEFYKLQNAYDPTHLNKQGDRLYTEKIATAFNDAMAKPKKALTSSLIPIF